MELKVSYIVDGCYSAILISKPMSKLGCKDCIFLSGTYACICNEYNHGLYLSLYGSIDKLVRDVRDDISIKTACDIVNKNEGRSVIIDLYEYKELSIYLSRYIFKKYESKNNRINS